MTSKRTTNTCHIVAPAMVLAALLMLIAACGGDTPVLVNLTGSIPGVEFVDLVPNFGGQSGEVRRISMKEHQLVLWIPSGRKGLLRLDAVPVYSDLQGCALGHAVTSVEVEPGFTRPISTTLDLNLTSATMCPLSVELYGVDTVTGPPALECQHTTTCRGWFRLGQSVQLTAGTRASSRFAQWSGGCRGTGATCDVVVAGASSVQVRDSRGTCLDTDWCWQNPVHTNRLMGVWGADADNVWAVGQEGFVQKWDGAKWQQQNSGTANSLAAVWGTDVNNLWAVGANGTIIRWNGVTWDRQTSGVSSALFDVWGTDARHVWAVGREGTILTWDGRTWTKVDIQRQVPALGPALFNSVWGFGEKDLWVVGTGSKGGTILHWNGKTWTKQEQPPTYEIEAVWGFDKDHVWATGWYGTFLKLDSETGTWKKETGISSDIIKGVDVINDVWGTDPNHVWAAGASGALFMFDPQRAIWSRQSAGSSIKTLRRLWGADSRNVWAIGDGGAIIKWNGERWTVQAVAPSPYLYAISGVNEHSIWSVGESGAIFQWSGATWVDQSQQSSTQKNLKSVWAFDENNVWAAGDGGTVIRRANGTGWEEVRGLPITDPRPNLEGIWGFDLNNIWVVGDNCTILKWDGGGWTTQNVMPVKPGGCGIRFFAVWGTDQENVWAVGTKGTIVRWDPKEQMWLPQASNVTNWLYSIWGTGKDDVWVVGNAGTILKWNGETWSQQTTSDRIWNSLTSVRGVDANNVWVVGYNDGIILKWNGATWSRQASIHTSLQAVWGTDVAHLWAVGSSATGLHYQP